MKLLSLSLIPIFVTISDLRLQEDPQAVEPIISHIGQGSHIMESAQSSPVSTTDALQKMNVLKSVANMSQDTCDSKPGFNDWLTMESYLDRYVLFRSIDLSFCLSTQYISDFCGY